jgi:hypothetical protein
VQNLPERCDIATNETGKSYTIQHRAPSAEIIVLWLPLSKCWGNGDERLTCVACHDPHTPTVREAE